VYYRNIRGVPSFLLPVVNNKGYTRLPGSIRYSSEHDCLQFKLPTAIVIVINTLKGHLTL